MTRTLPAHRTRPLARHGERALWALVLAVVAAWAVVPGWFTDRDPLRGSVAERLRAPSAEHWFGTDELGRDLYARVVHGTAPSLTAALLAVTLAFTAGVLLGALAGFFRGWVDLVVSRVTDVLFAVPGLLVALAGVTVLGFGVVNVAVAVAVAGMSAHARVMRAEVLKVSGTAFVEAAAGSGVGRGLVLLRHVLPNAIGPVVSMAVLEVGGVVLTVSALSFLGFGAAPPTPEWGALVASGRDHLRTAWWLTTFPGLAVALLVLGATRLVRLLEPARGRTR